MEQTEKQTYREAIQSIIQQTQDLYDKIGALRDAAGHNEKFAFNQGRGLLSQVWPNFQKLDNTLSDERAKMPLNGRY